MTCRAFKTLWVFLGMLEHAQQMRKEKMHYQKLKLVIQGLKKLLKKESQMWMMPSIGGNFFITMNSQVDESNC